MIDNSNPYGPLVRDLAEEMNKPEALPPVASSLPIVETLNKLPEVTWDRFAGDAVDHVSVFGWIERDDGRSDFAMVMIDKEGPWLISTSSARYSAEFSTRLGMDTDGHTGCRRVEDHFPGVRCVRLNPEADCDCGGRPHGKHCASGLGQEENA